MKTRKYVIGIDASNLRRGGGITHLVELCCALDTTDAPVEKVIVWGGTVGEVKLREYGPSQV